MLFESLNDSALVATHARECIRHFEQVGKSLEKAEPHIKQKIPRGRIDDEFDRFKIWCGNVGAHRIGKGSLDYKLREASNIRGQVIKLLKSMNLSLKEADEILTGARIPWEDLSDSESDTSEDLDKPDTTELGQNVFSLLEINTCLMRLSMAIRNPAPHDQFKESAHFKVSHFEHFDKEHVRAKFPDAEEHLLIRLGKAISRRRQYLSYREEHRQKLGQGLEPAAQPKAVESLIVDGPNPEIMDAPLHRAETVTDLSERVASTVASSLPSAFKAGISVAELIDEADYEEALSETSYASSGPESARLRPPRIPKAGEDGDPFECPLCFRITSAQHERAWHKHVYRDLQPYMCTKKNCETADRIYQSRHEWFHHELQVHRKWWKCIDGCGQPFQSQDELRAHLLQHHPDIANELRIDDLLRTCERQHNITENEKVECPLCHDDVSSLSRLRRHLGKHLEELALFALPSRVNDDGDATAEENSDLRSLSSEADVGDSLESLSDDERHDEASEHDIAVDNPASSHSQTPTALGLCAPILQMTEEEYNRSRLWRFYQKRNWGNISHMEWNVDGKMISIREAKWLLDNFGPLQVPTTEQRQVLGRALGFQGPISDEGADVLNTIFREHLEPFDKHVEADRELLLRVPKHQVHLHPIHLTEPQYRSYMSSYGTAVTRGRRATHNFRNRYVPMPSDRLVKREVSPTQELDPSDEASWSEAESITLDGALYGESICDQIKTGEGKFEITATYISFVSGYFKCFAYTAEIKYAEAIGCNKLDVQAALQNRPSSGGYYYVEGLTRLVLTFYHDRDVSQIIVRILRERAIAQGASWDPARPRLALGYWWQYEPLRFLNVTVEGLLPEKTLQISLEIYRSGITFYDMQSTDIYYTRRDCVLLDSLYREGKSVGLRVKYVWRRGTPVPQGVSAHMKLTLRDRRSAEAAYDMAKTFKDNLGSGIDAYSWSLSLVPMG